MVTGAHTTWCYVADMERSIAFYQDFLGLTLHTRTTHWSDFVVGHLTLGLHLGSHENAVSGGWILGLETDDLLGLHKLAVEKGVATEGGFHQTPPGVVLTFLDPDGNRVQVAELGSTIDRFTH